MKNSFLRTITSISAALRRWILLLGPSRRDSWIGYDDGLLKFPDGGLMRYLATADIFSFACKYHQSVN